MDTMTRSVNTAAGLTGGMRRSFVGRLLAAACAALTVVSAVEGRAGPIQTISPSSSALLTFHNIPTGPYITLDRDPLFLVMGHESRYLMEARSAVKFALPPASGPQAPIVSAVFYLTVNESTPSTGGAEPEFDVWADRAEDGMVTENDFWGEQGLFLGGSGPIPMGGDLELVYAFDATAFLRSAVAAGTPFVTLTLLAPMDRGPAIWNSANDPIRAPRLVITYAIPEPSSALLAGVGLAGLLVARRVTRRRV
jgi:hypothetical protein